MDDHVCTGLREGECEGATRPLRGAFQACSMKKASRRDRSRRLEAERELQANAISRLGWLACTYISKMKFIFDTAGAGHRATAVVARGRKTQSLESQNPGKSKHTAQFNGSAARALRPTERPILNFLRVVTEAKR